jgi:phage terminase large subunit-like protein
MAKTRPLRGTLAKPGPKPQLALAEPPPWEAWQGKDEARRAARWVSRYAITPTGYGAGEPMRLASFQRELIGDTYGNLATFASLPTGQGKTTLLGALALERISRGDDYAEVDVIATKLGQAGEVVLAASRMAELQPELRARCALYDEGAELRYRPTGSRLRVHAARIKAIEGLNFSLGIVDEVGFALDDLVESLIARLGKRGDAHLLGIGTPGFDPNILWRIRRDSLEGELPPGVVYREWSAPEGCPVDDRRAWRQANPAMAAGFLNPAALELQATLLPESKFRVYHLGQWVDQAEAWLPPGSWEACPYVAAPPDGAVVVLGVEGTYQRTVAVCGAALDGSVFFGWAAERATDDELAAVLAEACERWEVLEVTHNRRIRTRLFARLRAEGIPLEPWPLGVDTEAASANELFRAIVEARVAHDHDDLVAEHVRNLRARYLADGSLRLVRPPDGAPVDAALAMRAAYWRAAELADTEPLAPVRIY